MSILQISKLNKVYSNKQILNNIDMSVNAGRVVSIIGPSGEGKSTLLRCIAGIEKPTSGEIKIEGKVSMVFQQFNLFQNMSIYRNIYLPLVIVKKLTKTESQEITNELLSRTGLTEIKNSFPAQISGGQAQRVAIVRALAFDPQVILFDEPTSSLDPFLKKDVLDLIREIATEKQKTILLVTHEVNFAKEISDEIYTLRKGRLDKS